MAWSLAHRIWIPVSHRSHRVIRFAERLRTLVDDGSAPVGVKAACSMVRDRVIINRIVKVSIILALVERAAT
jgi:hypothetical protein